MQFGFRKNHSTETANCYFTEQIKSSLDEGGVVGAVLFDFKKTFPMVSHNVPLSRLSQFIFSTNELTRMESQELMTHAHLSLNVPFEFHILFSLYINDLPLITPRFAHLDVCR